MKKILLLACVASLLTGCGNWKQSAKPFFEQEVILKPLPEGVRPCKDPVEIDWAAVEAGVYGPEDLFKGWAQDRTRLVQCKRSNDSLIIYLEDLRQELQPGEVKSLSHIPM
jgi:hypothetical protein